MVSAMSESAMHSSAAKGRAKSEPAAARAKTPAVPAQVPGGEAAILSLQAQAGNSAVQRMLQRRALVQREGTIYMDQGGVGHKEPEKTKSHGTFFMDSSGVGHKEPEKTKSHGTFFMDSSGVGHKAPDSSRPTPFFMDSSGVGHDKPDDVDPVVQQVLGIIQQSHDEGVAEALKVTTGMAQWPARLVQALAKQAEARSAANTGIGLFNVEAADSGRNAATEAEKADAASAATKKAYDDTVAESVNVKAAAKKIADWGTGFGRNLKQFRKDQPKWNKQHKDSSMTTGAVSSIDKLFVNQGKVSQDALNLAATVDGEIAKFKTAWDTAAASAADAWKGLSSTGGNTFTVVGILQQKLNATRADGAARLPIHAFFDNPTKAAVHAYQGAKGIPVTDRADVATWTAIDADAPSIVVNGQLTVKAKEQATGSTPADGNKHETVSFGSSGNAVKELQQRLNNWRIINFLGVKPPFKALAVDGKFGFFTNSAVKKFQKSVNITANGNVGKLTWTELDKVAGGITHGAQSFYSTEVVEGALAGGTSAFDWDFKDNKLVITVKIQFTGASGHPMVNTWLEDIKSVWNNYKAVELNRHPARDFDIEFVPKKSSSAKHTVRVGKPTKKDPNPRSDTDNWYVNDNRRGLAPHEFGHLVGLDDEYNRPEESYVNTTGLEPAIAKTRADDGTGSVAVADEIHGILTGNPGKTTDQKLGMVADKLDQHGISTGAFARLVQERYRTKYGFDGTPDIAQYFYKFNNRDWTSNLTRATEPFTVSNGSLMGEMTSNLARGQDLTKVAEHEHPVQPRHVASFANLLSLVFPGSKWKPERR